MAPAIVNRFRATQTHNVKTLRHGFLPEVSGSLGDLGTLLPLLIALTLSGSISLPATLLFMGASNILTGVVFGLPLPVQPMKAIAAVALAKHFSINEMAASGIMMGIFIGVLSVTGTITWVERRIPRAVIRGIMVGAGLQLCITAGKGSLLGNLGWTGPWWGDNLLIALAAAAILLFSLPLPRFPYALFVFVVGIILAIISIHTTKHHHAHVPDRALHFKIHTPSAKKFLNATFTASLGQLPLTLLNSIIAVTALSTQLLPSRPPPSTRNLGISIMLMNLIAPWFGGMPACHGSGGLAGQYRFGARSGSSVILLGAAKLILGFVALWKGGPVAHLLGEFPRAILGIMVLAAGVELARAGVLLGGTSEEREGHHHVTELGEKDEWLVLLVTVGPLLAFRNDAVGFVAGMCWYYGTIVANKWARHEGGWRSVFRARGSRTDEERRGLLS